MTYPAIIFWILIVMALFSKGPAIYSMFFISWSFGTLAVVPPELVGGVSLTPAWITTLAMTAKTVANVGLKSYVMACLDYRRFLVLTLCTIYALLTAYFMPALFAGKVNVVVMRLTTYPTPVPLISSTANITQSIYFLLTSIAVIDIYFAARNEVYRGYLLNGFIWGAVAAIGTGFVDLAASSFGLTSLLAPFRNASYALMVDDAVGSMKRVVGLMSEASAYATLCISFLAPMMLLPLAGRGVALARLRLPLCAVLVLCLYLSTSSGGYVALLGVLLVTAFSVGLGVIAGRKGAWWAAYGFLIAGVVGIGVLVFAPEVSNFIVRLVDGLVLQKSSSSSYRERSEWNRVAMNAFLGTNGMGVGLGSARASSWIVAVISNLGVIGTGLLVLFMGILFVVQPHSRIDRRLATEAKYALLPNFLVLALSATSVNFGLPVAWLFGLIAALSWHTRVEPVAEPQVPVVKNDELVLA